MKPHRNLQEEDSRAKAGLTAKAASRSVKNVRIPKDVRSQGNLLQNMTATAERNASSAASLPAREAKADASRLQEKAVSTSRLQHAVKAASLILAIRAARKKEAISERKTKGTNIES